VGLELRNEISVPLLGPLAQRDQVVLEALDRVAERPALVVVLRPVTVAADRDEQLGTADGELLTNAIVDAIAGGHIPHELLGRAVGILNRIEWSREMDSISQIA
jgi:hypothetical protein